MLVTAFVLLEAAVAGAFGHPPPSPDRQAASRPEAAVRRADRDGGSLYRTYCAACHGTTGTGGGTAAVAMKVSPPDLTRLAVRNNGRFPSERVRQIIQGKGPAAHGERNMPVWGDVFARKEADHDPATLVDALVRYLDALQERRTE